MRFQSDVLGYIAVASEVAAIYRVVTDDPIACSPATTHDPKNNSSVLPIRNSRLGKIAGDVMVTLKVLIGADCAFPNDL